MYHSTPHGLEEALMLLLSLENAVATEPDFDLKSNYAEFLAARGLGAASICGNETLSGVEPSFDNVVQVWQDFLGKCPTSGTE